MRRLAPLISILGAFKVGDFFKRIIHDGQMEEIKARPRVQVTGPKVKPLVCQICLGRIKDGCEYVKCSSGKVFHAVCLSRTGSCPYCQQKHFIRGQEVSARVSIESNITSINLPIADAAPLKLGEVECPLCGKKSPTGTPVCSCGMVFSDQAKGFRCPECGSQVPSGVNRCPGCGETFEFLEVQTCPLCGRICSREREICECGCVLSSRCPECGNELQDTDVRCTNCGASFEFL